MVQIIPRVQSSGDRLARAFANAGSTASQLIPQEMMDRKERGALADRFGDEFKDVRNPDLQKLLLSGKMQQESQRSKLRGDAVSNAQSAEVIEKYFGPSAAEIWPHLTEGGRTAFFQSLLQGKERGEDFNKVLSNYFQENPEELSNIMSSSEDEEGPIGISNNRRPSSGRQPGITSKTQEELSKKELEDSQKYLGEIREKDKRAQSLSPVFDELEEVVQQGGADALSWGNLAEIGNKMGGFFGGTLSAIGKAQESGETGKFRTLSKNLLDQMKEIFGGQIRVKELEVFLTMLPEIGKSKEANLSAIDVLRRMSRASSMFYETAQDIIDKNGGRIPKNLADQVQKTLKKPLSDLASDITATTKRYGKSQEPKQISRDIANEIFKEAGGDKNLARKIAKERGYKL